MTRTSQPKISIIIPIYNSQDYLGQCLDSLLSQTYKNLEIICVDDGSKDNALKILEHYKKLDGRILVLAQENQGQSFARNKGVEISTGEWITFLDSDDWVGLECYEEFCKALNQKDFDIFMFNGASFTKDENNPNDLQLRDFFTAENWNKPSGELCTFKDCKNPFEGNLSVYNKIYKTEFIKNHNLKFVNFSIMEDELYWIEAFCASTGVYLCDKIFYFYRQHSGSTLHNLDINIFDIFKVFDKIKQVLINYNYYDMAKYALLQHKFRQFAYFFFTIPENLREDFFNNAKANLRQENDFDINIIKRLRDFPLYFGFVNMNMQEFYDNFKSAVR